MNLAAPAVRALPPERLARMMTLTAEDVPPMTEDDERLPGFERELALLRKAAQEGLAPFSAAALDGYLAEYRAAGYPPASHSPRYRAAYRPALSGGFQRLCRSAAAAFRHRRPNRAGQARAGRAGRPLRLRQDHAGRKTEPPVRRAHGSHGRFFPAAGAAYPERLSQPGGNIHYERFLSEVLPRLTAGEALSYGSFDCHHGVTRPVFLPQSPVRIVEGSYALHPRFEESYRAADALTVFLCVSPAEQLRRIEKRSPALLERFREVWIPP